MPAESDALSPSGVRTATESHNRVVYPTPEALFASRQAELVRSLTLVASRQEAAEDAVQEAFIQLCLHWGRVGHYDDPVAWVRRVALNRLRNLERGLGRRARMLLRLGEQAEEVASEEIGAVPGFSSDVVSALRSLPLRQRTALVLHYAGDLSVSEVARSMGISTGAVNRHLFRGRETLRRTVGVEP